MAHAGAREWAAAAEVLEALLGQSADGVLIARPGGDILRANPAACTALGRSEQDLRRLGRAGIVVPAPRVAEMLQERERTGSARGEVFLRRSDGSAFAAELTSAIVPVPGSDALAVVTFRDVSAQRRVEQRLRESEERLRLFVEHAPAAIAMLDRDMRYLAVSRRWMIDYRLNGGPVLGRSHYDVFPEVPARWKEIHRRCLEGAVEACDEEPFPRADGSVEWVRWEVRPWRTAAGEIGGLVIFSEVITERKRAEAEVARQRAVVEGVARIFREALTCPTEAGLGAACLAIAREVTQSRAGFIGEVAPAARRLQVVAGERGPMAAASLPLRGIYRRVLLRREVAVVNDPGAVPREAGGWAGAAPPRSFLAVPLLHAGRAVGLLGLADREGGFGPDQIAAAEALGLAMVQALTSKRAQEALRVADQRKTDFLAVLSHELRNPLAPIRNGIYLLDRAPPGSGQAQRAMDAIRRQTDQLTRLVDDLLDISRISHGKITLRRTRLDAREVIRRACEDQQPTFDERAVVLVLSLPEHPVWIDADATRLAQIATNLLSNAVKFTPRAGRVDVTLESAEDVSVLRVRDTGEGIEPHLLDHIFEPFAQAERTRGTARGGMGIGLALVKSLAAMHGGAARARSEGPGRGAEFAVTLPLAEPPEAPRVAGPGARAPSGLSVLLVEDNRDAGETLRDILELQGHRARLALDGQTGLAAFLEAVPDVVICDVGLPDMTGYEVVRRLRLLPGGATVLAVALTGYAQPEDVDAARAAGFDAHLAKPPPLEELDALLARASERRR